MKLELEELKNDILKLGAMTNEIDMQITSLESNPLVQKYIGAVKRKKALEENLDLLRLHYDFMAAFECQHLVAGKEETAYYGDIEFKELHGRCIKCGLSTEFPENMIKFEKYGMTAQDKQNLRDESNEISVTNDYFDIDYALASQLYEKLLVERQISSDSEPCNNNKLAQMIMEQAAQVSHLAGGSSRMGKS